MITIQGVARLGRDAEVRYLASGDAVAGLSLAFSAGKKDDQGNRPTTWVKAVLFGKRAESLANYLTKGTQVCVVLSDARLTEYQKKDGTAGAALEAKVELLDFVGSREQSADSAPAAPAPPPQRQAPPRPAPSRPAANLSDMEDDIPF
ncbi:Ssb Single-stranded DNA-binding protein [uncultured Caudovirales phage]|uniref:Single-stranded DNA-binding protein n=1 Tax=uncultured Caudovirales phage TaxID=2100421 RepID=A0A6J5KS18_9CAUD|nr:Ssb Single-stranded DNA-binding protein [uncultured Caudovirales phage]